MILHLLQMQTSHYVWYICVMTWHHGLSFIVIINLTAKLATFFRWKWPIFWCSKAPNSNIPDARSFFFACSVLEIDSNSVKIGIIREISDGLKAEPLCIMHMHRYSIYHMVVRDAAQRESIWILDKNSDIPAYQDGIDSSFLFICFLFFFLSKWSWIFFCSLKLACIGLI